MSINEINYGLKSDGHVLQEFSPACIFQAEMRSTQVSPGTYLAFPSFCDSGFSEPLVAAGISEILTAEIGTADDVLGRCWVIGTARGCWVGRLLEGVGFGPLAEAAPIFSLSA